MPYYLRSVDSSDLQNLLSLIHLKSEFDGCPDAVTATAEKLNQTLFGSQPMAYVLLAEAVRDQDREQGGEQGSEKDSEKSDSPVGYASYHFTYSTFLAQPSLWLDDLFVKSEYRNQSIGTQFIQQLCQIADSYGCGRIDWTVNVHNHPGIRFYQRIGGRLNTEVRMCRLNREAIAQHVS